VLDAHSPTPRTWLNARGWTPAIASFWLMQERYRLVLTGASMRKQKTASKKAAPARKS